jgi:hypothetical protein
VMKGNYNDKQTCTCTSTSSTSCKLDP